MGETVFGFSTKGECVMGDGKVLIYCKDCKTIFASNPRGCPWCIIKKLQEDKKTLRRIEGVLKTWASVINPDYKKIYVEIRQALALGGR